MQIQSSLALAKSFIGQLSAERKAEELIRQERGGTQKASYESFIGLFIKKLEIAKKIDIGRKEEDRDENEMFREIAQRTSNMRRYSFEKEDLDEGRSILIGNHSSELLFLKKRKASTD